MMCSGSEKVSELDFVRLLTERLPGGCAGPIVKLGFTGHVLDLFEAGLCSEDAWDFLLASYLDEGERLIFGVCAVHWLDLSHMLWRNSMLHGRVDWLSFSASLLDAACRGAELDPKEISNMLVWRGVSLT